MADSTLDDFFAKKDKSKKGKSKTKYTTSDTIAKKLEDGGKKADIVLKKDTKDKIPISTTTTAPSISIPSVPNEQEDDEWKNIEEKETDYSGLRIQALSISEKEKEEEQLKEQMLSEQNGESTRHSDGQSGPWKVVQTPQNEVEEEKPPQPEEPVQKDDPPTPKPTGAYKPPAMRNASATPLGGSQATRRHPKHAPQITSEVHFPSLSSAVDNKYKLSESDRSFQSVKHGVRSKGESQKEMQLDLENKFSALNE